MLKGDMCGAKRVLHTSYYENYVPYMLTKEKRCVESTSDFSGPKVRRTLDLKKSGVLFKHSRRLPDVLGMTAETPI